MKWLQASAKVYRIFVAVSFGIFLCVILLCSLNWYVQISSKCSTSEPGDIAEFTYEPESTSKVYLKLFYGVCRKDSTAGTDHCYLWDDADAWQYFDDMNKQISNRHSLLADAAANRWPIVKYVTVFCLVVSFFLFVFYCVVACIGEVAWIIQIVAGVTQLFLALMLALSLGLGLQTDTVKPQMFGNFFYGCSVHAEPGASWWFGVLALVVSIFAGFILMFPYLGGPTWVLKWARSVSVGPSEDDDEYNRHRDELGMPDDSDPFAGIYLQDDDDDLLGEDEEWVTDDEGDEENPPHLIEDRKEKSEQSRLQKRLSHGDSMEKYKYA